MHSHTDKDTKKLAKAPTWMNAWHVIGNDIADDMAGTASDLHSVHEQHATPLIELIGNLALIPDRYNMGI